MRTEENMSMSRTVVTHHRLLRRLAHALSLAALIVLGGPSVASAQAGGTADVQFSHITQDDDGLAGSRVRAIVQDRHGFMWLGSWNGLSRYNGGEVEVFRNEVDDPSSLSHNLVTTLTLDQTGVLWVGTLGGGLNRFDETRASFERFRHDPDDSSTLSSEDVVSVYHTDDGLMWVGTWGGGLNLFDPATGTATRYAHDPDDDSSLSGNRVVGLHEDEVGGVWVSTFQNGLNQFNPQDGSFNRYVTHGETGTPLDGDWGNNRAFHEDDGKLWYAAKAGLFTIDVNTQLIQRHPAAIPFEDSPELRGLLIDRSNTMWVHGRKGFARHDADGGWTVFANDPLQRSTISPFDTLTTYQDRSGLIWVGSSCCGVDTFLPERPNFRRFAFRADDSLTAPIVAVHGVHQTGDETLWITTHTGVQSFDLVTGETIRYSHDPNDPRTLGSGRDWVAIAEDPTGDLWFGGIEAAGLNRLDRTTGEFTTYRHDPNDVTTLSDATDSVLSIAAGADGELWVGTRAGGLNRFDLQTELFLAYRHDPDDSNSLSDDNVRVIHIDDHGALWLGSWHRGLTRFEPSTGEFTRFQHDPTRPNESLANNTVYSIFEDGSGTLWISTAGGLSKLDPSTGSFTNYRETDGLPSSLIHGVLEDDAGDLWVSSSRGLSRFDPRDLSVTNFDAGDGLQANEFSSNAALRTSAGELIFGGSAGMNIFSPADIGTNPYSPPVVLTDFRLFNRSVEIGADGSPLSKHISVTDTVTLEHQDSVFTIDFAALSFYRPERNQYAYRLEGFDDDWTTTNSSRRSATYTNLDPGTYTLMVKASNNDGLWNDEATTLRIIVKPRWWATWWFRLLAVIAILAITPITVALRMRAVRRNNRRLEATVAEQTAELRTAKEEAEAASLAKGTFLSSMSHELRTPLNAILGFTQLIQKDDSLSDSAATNLAIINRSGSHLLSLINDVLDMAKIEAGSTELQLEPTDLWTLLEEVRSLFAVPAATKKLWLRFETERAPRFVMADGAKLRQVLMNLIGNAIKFTETGGVTVAAHIAAEGSLQIHVEDTGVGMEPAELDELFGTFTQTSSGKRLHSGTGLGLALSQQIIRLMGGDISAWSSIGEGSRFTIDLDFSPSSAAEVHDEAERPIVTGLLPAHVGRRILVVDDIAENRSLLVQMLKGVGFDVQEATDGERAIKAWRAWTPELIFMDMRMSIMDGFAATQHIATHDGPPTTVIAVTASSFKQERRQMFDVGCAGYIMKPYREHEIYDVLEEHLGVEYRYQHRAPTPASSVLNLTVEDLRVVPADVRARLREAAASARVSGTQEQIKLIADEHPEIARQLRQLVHDFRFDVVVQLLPEREDAPALAPPPG